MHRRRRFQRARRTVLLALVVVLAAIGPFIETASAARLNLTSPSRTFAMTATRCSNATLTVAVNGSNANVSGLDVARCRGRILTVFVHSGTATLTGSVAVSSGTADVALSGGATSVQAATATLDTWPIPVTWSAVPPVTPLVSCRSLDNPSLSCSAAVETLTNPWNPPPNRQYRLYVRISTTSETHVRWAVTINFSSALLPFTTRGASDIQGGLQILNPVVCSANPRTVTVQQIPSWQSAQVVAGGPDTFIDVFGYETQGGGLMSCP